MPTFDDFVADFHINYVDYGKSAAWAQITQILRYSPTRLNGGPDLSTVTPVSRVLWPSMGYDPILNLASITQRERDILYNSSQPGWLYFRSNVNYESHHTYICREYKISRWLNQSPPKAVYLSADSLRLDKNTNSAD